MAVDMKELEKELKDIEGRTQPWRIMWQTIGEFVRYNKSEFQTKHTQGEFLNRNLYDSTAVFSNRQAASMTIGLMWQNGGRSLRIEPSSIVKDAKENKDYFNKASNVMAEAFDDPDAGFASTLEEVMFDQYSFGTSGVGSFGNDPDAKDFKADIRFEAWTIDETVCAENADGKIDINYRTMEMTVREVVQEFGIKEVSKKISDAYNDGNREKKVKIVWCIRPRDAEEVDETAKDNRKLPYMSVHYEKDGNHTLKESGYPESPVAMARIQKTKHEVYGRAPAMDVLPEIQAVNVLAELLEIAIEKSVDPALVINDDGSLGGGVIDSSAGAINTLDLTNRQMGNANPLFQLQDIGDVSSGFTYMEQLQAKIARGFHIDRLLDFNNQTSMTLGETQIRNQIRFQSLNSIFNRLTDELFTPVIVRVFNILLSRGKLGVVAGSEKALKLQEAGEDPLIIPEEIAKLMAQGKNVFKVGYITPAERMRRAEEAQGIIQTWGFAGDVANVKPEVLDVLDEDKSLELIREITGAPSQIIRDAKEIAKVREKRAADQQKMIDAQTAEVEANTAKAETEAVNNVQPG